MTVEPMLDEVRSMTDTELRDRLGGNLCRCTGYQNIIAAVRAATTSDAPDASDVRPTPTGSPEDQPRM